MSSSDRLEIIQASRRSRAEHNNSPAPARGTASSRTIKDSPSSQQFANVPEYAGGDSLLKGSPGSSVSFSQSPGVWNRHQEELAARDSYKPPAKRARKQRLPPSSSPAEPLSKLDIFLGIDASMKALAKKNKPPAVAKAVVSRRPLDAPLQQPQADLFSTKSTDKRRSNEIGVAARESTVKSTGNDDVDDDFFAPRTSTSSQQTAHSAWKPSSKPKQQKKQLHDDDEDDDEFFATLFSKPPATKPATALASGLSNGISESVQAAQDEAQSAPPTPAKPASPGTFSRQSTSRDDPSMADSPPVAVAKRSLSQACSRQSSPTPSMTSQSRFDSLNPSIPDSPSPAAAAAVATTAQPADELSPDEKPRYSWSSRSAAARNPIAKLKQDQVNVFQGRTLQSAQPSQGMEDSLWDDSDEESEAVKPPPKKKGSRKKQDDVAKQPKARGRPSITAASPTAKPRAPSKPRATTAALTVQASSDAVLYTNSRIDATDDVYSNAALIPEFDEPKFYFPEIGRLAVGPSETNRFYVPESIARYLGDYQRDGVEFMCTAAIEYGGALLGDDMGLGKTVQVIALIAALLEKKGTGEDMLELAIREEIGRRNRQRVQDERDHAVRNGRMPPQDFSQLDLEPVKTPAWAPILILVPTNIVDHWMSDMNLWGHFGLAVYRSGGPKLSPLIESILMGMHEVLLCSTSMFCQDATLVELKRVDWKLIVIDEIHFAKSKKTKLSKNIRGLKNSLRDCRVIGLSGTPMQNKQFELWNIIDLVIQGHLDTEKEFDRVFGKPIKMGRVKGAKLEAIKKAEEAKNELNETKLAMIHKRRTKEEQLKDELPSKEERVVFCSMTKVQKAIYEHILAQPDFACLKNMSALCDCGVNTEWCKRFLDLKTREEKIEYQRENRSLLRTKGDCCYSAPFQNGRGDEGDPIHRDAVMWQHQHPTSQLCFNCPYCCILPAMSVLSKVCSHASLLQVDRHNRIGKSADDFAYAKEMARVYIPDAVVDELPGKTRYREIASGVDEFALSGKLVVLHRLLGDIQKKNGRVLLFSESTQTLDLIEEYMMGRYGYLRMDGKTPKELRTQIAADFKQDITKFVFLLSKKAFGTGLTLTAANYVIMFDTAWNPALDSQSCDRAFRIGQTRDVVVFRMVTKGTIEELRYLRQVYKVQLRDETIADTENPDRAVTKKRLFRGVAGDRERKGELFGIANLLKFKDGFFHNYGKASGETARNYGEDVHGTDDVLQQISNDDTQKLIGEDEALTFEAIEDIAKELAKVKQNGANVDDDESDDEEILGAQSQQNMDILAQMRRAVDEESGDGENDDDDVDDVLSDAGNRLNQLGVSLGYEFDTEPDTASLAPRHELPTFVEDNNAVPASPVTKLDLASATNGATFPSPPSLASPKASANRPQHVASSNLPTGSSTTTISTRPVDVNNAVVVTAAVVSTAATSLASNAAGKQLPPPPSRHVATANPPLATSVPLPSGTSHQDAAAQPVATLPTKSTTVLHKKSKKKLRNFFFCGANPDKPVQLESP